MPEVCAPQGLAVAALGLSLAVLSLVAGLVLGYFVERRKARKGRHG